MINGLFVVRHDSTYGNISGTIISSIDLSPVEDAKVTLVSTGYEQISTSDGGFSIHTAPGSETVSIERYGFAPASFPVSVVTGGDSTVAITLAALSRGTLTGTVRSEGGTPLASAFVSLVGVGDWTDVEEYSDTTDGAGVYTLTDVPAGAWEVRTTLIGYNPDQAATHVSAGQITTLDYSLPTAIFADDFETDKGWTIGAPGDDATDGIWERAEPIGREIGYLNPSKDHTGDGFQCFITEQGAVYEPLEESEVDGTTSLLSPIIDLTSADDPIVGFYRYFAVNIGKNAVDGDSYVVAASSDSGNSWVTIDSTTSHFLRPVEPWFRFEFRVQDYLPVTDGFRLKLVITDRNAESPVEAGIDDFEIIEPIRTNVGVELSDNGDAAPARSSLLGNRPNPFNPTTSIHFRLARQGHADLEIYDVNGRLVRTLITGALDAGDHSASWDGRAENGAETASGIYFYRLRTAGANDSRKMILIR